MEEKLASLESFTPSQKLMGNDGNSGIAVDEGRKKICLIKQSMGNIDLDVLTYRDILSSEIFVDGVTITKTARGSQLGGALIGGLALGGVGAIIGGLSGNTTSSEKITKIDLQIIVNRTNNPIHDINFMSVDGKKNGIIYKSAMEQARHWQGLLTVLIKLADSEDISKEGEFVEDKQAYCQITPLLTNLQSYPNFKRKACLLTKSSKYKNPSYWHETIRAEKSAFI